MDTNESANQPDTMTCLHVPALKKGGSTWHFCVQEFQDYRYTDKNAFCNKALGNGFSKYRANKAIFNLLEESYRTDSL